MGIEEDGVRAYAECAGLQQGGEDGEQEVRPLLPHGVEERGEEGEAAQGQELVVHGLGGRHGQQAALKESEGENKFEYKKIKP